MFLKWEFFFYLSEGAVNHLKKARSEIWTKRSEKKQQKNYQDEDKKSEIDNKLILRLRSLISRGFPIKTIVFETSILFSLWSDIRILGAHLVDSLSISVKTVWVEPELLPLDSVICWYEDVYRQKICGEWYQLVRRWLRFFNDLIKRHLLWCTYPTWILPPNSSRLHWNRT